MNQDNLKLYSYWRSSASWRIRIALNLKKQSFEIESINLLQGQQLSKEYSDINPNNLLPALKVNDQILVQSPAILEYLEEVYPDFKLLPTDPFERAVVRGLMNVIVCDIHPVQNLRVLKKVESMVNSESVKQEWASHFIHLGFQGLEKMLKKTAGKYCYKDQITFADVCLVPQVYNALRFGVSMEDFPVISRVYKELSDLEEFKQAHPSMQPDAI
jgi:maleylacetoacetate isomerase